MIRAIGELDDYRWSGHCDIIGKTKKPWVDSEYILAQFVSTRRTALHGYLNFMRAGVGQGRMKELTGGGLLRSHGGWSQVIAIRRREQKEEFDERILGSGDFVNKVLKEAEDRQLRQMKHKRSGQTIQTIIDEECQKRGINRKELNRGSKRRTVSDARSMIAVRCRCELGLSAAEIARHAGVNTSSIIRAIGRAERRGNGERHN